MASLNKVMLIGNLTRDPEQRRTPSGMAVVEMGLAMNRRYKASSGEEREEVCYINVTVWGKTGEACAEYLRKGASCFVEGRLKLDEWEKDGQKRSKISVVADTVQFLDRGAKRGVEPGDTPEDAPARAARPAGGRPQPDATPMGPADDDIPF